jgi:hypothetical protein
MGRVVPSRRRMRRRGRLWFLLSFQLFMMLCSWVGQIKSASFQCCKLIVSVILWKIWVQHGANPLGVSEDSSVSFLPKFPKDKTREKLPDVI